MTTGAAFLIYRFIKFATKRWATLTMNILVAQKLQITFIQKLNLSNRIAVRFSRYCNLNTTAFMLIQTDDSPNQAFTKIHDQLKRAGVDKRHKFRFFTVATLKESEGFIPQSRMVVLRSFNEDWTFEFYTDNRSSKVTEIKNNSVISALFWDPSKRIQVRIEADAEIHNQDEISAKRWKHVQGDEQKAYTSVPAPGTPVDAPENAHEWPDTMDDKYFAVIRLVPKRIKILQISGMEHLALEFYGSSTADEWSGGWITP